MRSASARLMPGTRARSSTLAAWTPRNPPKCASSALRRVAPMPPISCNEDVARAVPLDGKAVCLVADLLQQVQAWIIRREVQRRFAIRKNDFLQTGLALGALGDPDEFRAVQPLFGEHLEGDAALTLSAVDDEQIGHWVLAGH